MSHQLIDVVVVVVVVAVTDLAYVYVRTLHAVLCVIFMRGEQTQLNFLFVQISARRS